jgi:hypothetical protein
MCRHARGDLVRQIGIACHLWTPQHAIQVRVPQRTHRHDRAKARALLQGSQRGLRGFLSPDIVRQTVFKQH